MQGVSFDIFYHIQDFFREIGNSIKLNLKKAATQKSEIEIRSDRKREELSIELKMIYLKCFCMQRS